MKFEVFGSSETEPDLFSRAIMLATQSNYSHCGILVNDTLIFHSTGIGFHPMPARKFELDHVYIERFELDVIDDRYAIGWLDGSIGKAYSKSQYPGFLHKAFRELGGDGAAEMICSEAVVRFAMACCALSFDGDADFITPRQAIELLKRVKVFNGSRPF